MKRTQRSDIVNFIHIDLHDLVHLLDLDLDHVQVLEDVYELLVPRVIPVLSLLLHLDYLVLHVFVVFDVLAELVVVATFAHTFGHHVYCTLEFILLSLHSIEGL